MWSPDDLIVAPATVPGFGARAIVRLAGDRLDSILPLLFSAADPGWPRPGERPRVVAAVFAAVLRRDWGGMPLAILCWPGPAGPIGGPLAEVQLPACGPLVAAVIAEACGHGARLARRGEFTLRSFLAGRLDLVQAEAVVGVTDARTPGELAAALDRLAGGCGRELGRARDGLLDLLADIEAAIDFADETAPDAVPSDPHWPAVAGRIGACEREIAAVTARLAGRDAGAADLPRVVLAGPPNVGKSSLFNAVLGRDAAVVTDEHGTTRDPLEARVARGTGRDWLLVDLAGLDGSGVGLGPVDAAARLRARHEIDRADVVLSCRDCRDAGGPSAFGERACRIDVRTRCDRGPPATPVPGEIATSVVTGRGIAELTAAVDAAVAGLPPSPSATLRMRVAAEDARRRVAEARRRVEEAAAGLAVDEAVVAASLRAAAESLGEATGMVFGGDLLDRIFSRHCIGK